MKLEEQVCSLKLAKKLEKLGVKQDSIFTHCKDWYGDHIIFGAEALNWKERVSAFTVAELGEMLPTLGIVWCKSSDGNGKDFWWGKTNYPSLEKQIEADDFTEADARAKMLIHLIEKGIVKP